MTSLGEISIEQEPNSSLQLPDRIPGPLEVEVDKIFDIEEGKNPRLDQYNLRNAIIDKLGRDAYAKEVFQTDINQALEYIGMTAEEVEATGHQLGVLLVQIALEKTPDEIREYLKRPVELKTPIDPKVAHMTILAAQSQRSRRSR